MHARKQEAYRALELLEQYYSRLNSPEDVPLRDAIGRVIKVFKSRLFQALIDIQEFYDSILMDDHADRAAKMNATHRFADDWENTPLVGNRPEKKDELVAVPTLVTTHPTTRDLPAESKGRKPTPTPFSQFAQPGPTTTTTEANSSPRPPASTTLIPPSDPTQFSYADHWKKFDVHLERPKGGGLGFSIAGGRDTPCINDSPAVVVTKVSEDGVAAQSGELKLHDIILRVNGVDFTNIDHQPAVDFLKSAGPDVDLEVRRLAPISLEEIELTKTRESHLGFSIGGGITHEHVKGDHGIFINKIIPGGIAAEDGRLRIGDRLLAVQSESDTYNLEFVEHKHAVEAIRRACEESRTIKLVVGHVTASTQSPLNPSVSSRPAAATNGHSASRDDDASGERHVSLRRGTNGFGFNIIGADEKIFISLVTPGGVADRSGLLKQGDQIVSVNGRDFRRINRDEATNILKSIRDEANFVVINKYNEYLQYDAQQSENLKRLTKENTGSASSVRATPRQPFYVRADFDYDPTKDVTFSGDKGLAFRKNDILHVLNAVDDNWWSAALVVDGREDPNERGIIPSKSRAEKKDRARQKRVKINDDRDGRSNTVEREKKKKRSFNPFNKTGEKRDTQSGEDSELEAENSESAASYTTVERHEIDYLRPVVVLGPFKDLMNDQLLADQPDKFGSCVPHTSRPRRNEEVEGREYHFVTSREQMERDIQNLLFIEVGEHNKHLYGTSINAVRDVMDSGKHCVLDISGYTVKRLLNKNIAPIVIFIKARDLHWIVDNMGNDANESRAQQILETANQVELQFNDLFAATIDEENLNETYHRALDVIDSEQAKAFVWIPAKEKI